MRDTFFKLTRDSSLALMLVSGAFFCTDVSRAHNKDDTDVIQSTGVVPLRLTVFDCGSVIIRDAALLNISIDQGREKILTNSCYLIKHPKGTLFWDTGVPDAIAELGEGKDVLDGAIHISLARTLKSQLADSDIDPLGVTYLGISHLHLDHVGNVSYFPQSKWLVQKVEYDIAFSEKAHERGFDQEVYATLANNPVETLDGNHDVFGDGSVVILSMPGHTEGHQALFVDLPTTGPIILSGDLYHFTKNRENYGIPVINYSNKQTVHSFGYMDEILELSGAQLWIQHDKEQNDTLKHAPEYYE